MVFRIGGNGDPFNKNNLGKHEVQDEAAVLPKPTVPVGQPQETTQPQHIDIGDLTGLESLGYQNMGLHIHKPSNKIEELTKFAATFTVADAPQAERNAAMAVAMDPDIVFGEGVDRSKLVMHMANASVPQDSQSRIAQLVQQFERYIK